MAGPRLTPSTVDMRARTPVPPLPRSRAGFRGVQAEQDGRFKSQEKKLFAKMKFPPQFGTKVDMRKVRALRPLGPPKINPAARCRADGRAGAGTGAHRGPAPVGHEEGHPVHRLRGRHHHQHGHRRARKGQRRCLPRVRCARSFTRGDSFEHADLKTGGGILARARRPASTDCRPRPLCRVCAVRNRETYPAVAPLRRALHAQEDEPDPRRMQVNLTGFLERNTGVNCLGDVCMLVCERDARHMSADAASSPACRGLRRREGGEEGKGEAKAEGERERGRGGEGRGRALMRQAARPAGAAKEPY